MLTWPLIRDRFGSWRRLAITLAALVACSAPLSGCGAQASGDPHVEIHQPSGSPGLRDSPSMTSWVKATTAARRATQQLTLDLLTKNADASGNTVISPYSIEQALALLALGARGQTASQIAHLLATRSVSQISGANAYLRAYLATITSTTSASTEPQLSNANSIWLDRQFAACPAFLRDADREVGVAVNRVDFAGAPDAARTAINNWVAEQTHKHIQQLFPQAAIDSSTLMVLVNAIYLDAHWQTPFNPALTAPGAFHTASGKTTTPEFMSLDDPATLKLARTASYAAVDLPYTGSNLSMLLVMPKHASLARFESGLTPSRLAALARDLRPERISVRIPRFSLALNVSLVDQLKRLGMVAAFDPDGANFSGIASQSLYVSAVQHAATLKVSEAGTIASAATGISIDGSSAEVPVTTISFDRPFIALIRDRLTGAILFAASVGDPTAS